MRTGFKTLKEYTFEEDSKPEALIGMAIHNRDNFLWILQAIDSIVEQSYTKFVFVIIFDGPIDETLRQSLIEKIDLHSKIQLIENENNSGLSTCMNYIFDQVFHLYPWVKYFFRMDADDISMGDRIEKQVRFFEQHPNIDILGTSLVEINESGKIVGKRIMPKSHLKIVSILPRRCPINHPTVGFRASIIRAGFRYKENYMNTQDYFFWVDLCAAGYKFANLKEVLLQFRRVNDFYKRRGFSKSINEFSARRYAMKRLKKLNFVNLTHALIILFIRMLPSKIIKIMYKLDRFIIKKRSKRF
ncbi:glycosyltransferase [Glaciecola sp. 1036]|uniref:glycosyltransferase n=1 Tax=Alteromonadaceae TaxID=72275 RepID=UPI003D057FB6